MVVFIAVNLPTSAWPLMKPLTQIYTIIYRVFIRHQRLENSPASTKNSWVKFRWPEVV